MEVKMKMKKKPEEYIESAEEKQERAENKALLQYVKDKLFPGKSKEEQDVLYAEHLKEMFEKMKTNPLIIKK